MHRKNLVKFYIGAAVCVAVGCQAPSSKRDTRMQHLVLVQLDDPALAPQMIADMQQAFAQIPQVQSWSAGTRIDTGRTGVPTWYTLGTLTQFESPEAFKIYFEHPLHKELVQKWKAHWKRSEIYDF